MTWELHRHDARRVSDLLEPETVDLIVTSPPYFALRSYQDSCPLCNGAGVASVPTVTVACPVCGGSGSLHYDGQIGSEPTPGEFVDALIACTADWLRVLRPGGSIWVNLGDKYANDAKWGGATGGKHVTGLHGATGIGRAKMSTGIPAKSLMGLPWRYAIRCIDELGLILRAEVIWSKPNGLPESVTDRVRRSHEQWFHFTRQGRYFAAIDEVREEHLTNGRGSDWETRRDHIVSRDGYLRQDDVLGMDNAKASHPLGKVPGSVWSVPSEPLVVPDSLGVDHFAAFPSELPRRIILGWSPSGYCTACGEPRRAVVDREYVELHQQARNRAARMSIDDDGFRSEGSMNGREVSTIGRTVATIAGYACACPDTSALTRPAVVLDPFAGTGTTVAVAHHLGRHGIGTDLSADYLRLAEWRCTSDRGLSDKVLDRSGIPNPDPPKIDGQLDLFDGVVA